MPSSTFSEKKKTLLFIQSPFCFGMTIVYLPSVSSTRILVGLSPRKYNTKHSTISQNACSPPPSCAPLTTPLLSPISFPSLYISSWIRKISIHRRYNPYYFPFGSFEVPNKHIQLFGCGYYLLNCGCKVDDYQG